MLRTNLMLAQRAIALQKDKDPTSLDVSRFVEGVVNLWSADPDDIFAPEDNPEAPAIILHDMVLDADLIGILGQALAKRNKGFQHVFLYNVPLKQEEVVQLVDILVSHANSKLAGIVLSRCELSDKCASALLKLNACTSSLDLSHNQFTSEGAAELCAWKGRLDLSYNQLDSTFINKLINLIESQSLQLSYLDISGNHFSDEDKNKLQEALTKMTSRCEIIVETSVAAQHRFEQNVNKSEKHRRLDSRFAGACSSYMVNTVIKSLVSNASQELSIINDKEVAQKIIDDAARAVVVLTSKDLGLGELHLGRGQLGGRGMEVIAASLAKGAMIKSLSIQRFNGQDQPLSVDELGQLLEASAGSSLLSLNLEGQALTDEHANHIAIFLQKNPALQQLSIANNSMTDVGINTIMQAFSSNNSLKELDLTGGNYTNAGARVIVEMVAMNCSLLTVKCDMLNAVNKVALNASMNRNKKIKDMPAIEKANALRQIVNSHPDMPQANRENLLNLAKVPSLQTIAADKVDNIRREAMQATLDKIVADRRAERIKTLIQYTSDHCSAALTEQDMQKIIACGERAGLTMGWWLNGFDYSKPEGLLEKLKAFAIEDANGKNNETLDILNRILAPKETNATKTSDKGKEEDGNHAAKQAALSKRLNTLREELTKTLNPMFEKGLAGADKTRARINLVKLLGKSGELTVQDFRDWRNAIEQDLMTVPADYPYTKSSDVKQLEVGKFNQDERDRYLRGLVHSLDLMKTFQGKAENIEFFYQDTHQFDMPDLAVTELSFPKLQYLRESIKNLSDYCASIHDDGESKKIADALTTQLDRIRCRTYTKDFNDATTKLHTIYNDNIDYLSQRRDNSLKHILVNVLLALSVIGFIAQVVNKATTGNMFFFFDSETTRRKLALNVMDDVNNLTKK